MTKIALIFPGQGAQAVGMGREFYDTSAEAKRIFDEADTVIPGLKDVIFNGPQETLTSTKYCQPGIFTYSVAALEALKAHPKYANMEPVFTAGLSLGELSAVAASGSLSFSEALKVVERRSFFMEEATRVKKGAMAAVIGFEEDKIVSICQEAGAEVANFNSPDQIVITGEAEAVNKAAAMIKDAGAKRVIPLDVSGAFHSTLMTPAVEPFAGFLQSVNFKEAGIPVVSNVDGQPASAPETIRQNLIQQITSSVQWTKSVEQMAAAGVNTFLEIGPGTVLKGLIRKINKDLTVYTIQKPEDLNSILDA